MNYDLFRVDDPPYETPAKMLSKALRNDMLVSAQHLRNCLYSISRQTKDSHYAEWDIERALLAMDFPHFIPMQNTDDALFAEYERLKSEVYEYDIFGNYQFNRVIEHYYDVEAELECRNFFTEGGEA